MRARFAAERSVLSDREGILGSFLYSSESKVRVSGIL